MISPPFYTKPFQLIIIKYGIGEILAEILNLYNDFYKTFKKLEKLTLW